MVKINKNLKVNFSLLFRITIINFFLFFLSYIIRKDKNIFLFGENTKLFNGNPKYLSIYLSKDKKNKVFFVVEKIPKKKYKNIIFIKRDKTFKIYYILLKARFIFVSGTHLDILKKSYIFFGNFKFINLWHGIPLKRIFFSSKNYLKDTNVLLAILIKYFQKKLNKKYCLFLSPSKNINKYIEDMTLSNKVIGLGQPRVDAFLNKKINFKINENINIKKKYKKVFFYSPTHREGKNYFILRKNFLNTNNINELNNIFFKKNFILIIKNHPSQKKILKKKYSNIIDITKKKKCSEEFFPFIDVLICDYSSLVYDFLIYNKPIILFIPDFKEYCKDFGIFEDIFYKEIFFKAKSFSKLLELIKNPNNLRIDKKKQKKMMKFVYDTNLGKSCENICKYLKID